MAEKEPESSVVTFTDGDGCVRYADRHSKAYLKHLAREKAKWQDVIRRANIRVDL